ncbi:TadE/TadG family type IV pilus assembly protein [Phytohabitans rumicis]|uniref:Pilus assembly protein n=1 Tax=Phytohabitans rumicis TaxID=1076125 RepID=A0A6V8LEQ4_9ACTN|nr:TadE/TadG family type IV pilus assembly protein [Phytohabitans rumicis]GFJ93301.1 hypothetical protein Prum_069430 [Phytohabitans rumicis]
MSRGSNGSPRTPGRPHPAARTRGDRGAVAVEFAIGLPMLVLAGLLIAGSIVMARTNLDVNTAAAAAARAASQSRDAATARAAANDAAQSNLAGRCTTLSVQVDTSGFRRGGLVTVTVECIAAVRRLTGLGLPGTMAFTATAASPVDVFRGVPIHLVRPQPGGRNV